jgi:hypothetical protein
MAIPDSFKPLSRLAPHVTGRFEQLVMRALELSVSQRWKSARDMLAFLVSGPLPVYNPDYYTPPPAVHSPTVLVPGGSAAYSGPSSTPLELAPPASAPPRSGRSSGTSVRLMLGAGVFLCLVMACLGYFVGLPLVRDWLEETPVATQSGLDVALTSPVAGTTPAGTTPGVASPTPSLTGPATSEFRVTVANEAPDDVCYVNISTFDADEWGRNWLEGDQRIVSGTERSFDLSVGSYDIRLQRCDSTTMATFWRIDFATTLEVGAAGATARLLIENDARVDVCFLHVSPTTADDWGQDWLGDLESLGTGSSRVIYIPPGTYDLQIMDCDNNVLVEEYALSLRQDRTWTVTD